MVDLFRYVEHDFAVPAPTDAIDVVNESDFQAALNDAAESGTPGGDEATAGRVRELADVYLTRQFASPTDDPATLGTPLNALPGVLRKLPTVTSAAVRSAIRDTFGLTAEEIVGGTDFTSDLEQLQNSVLAVKLVTGFNRVDSTRLARQLRAATFLQYIAATDNGELTRAELERVIGRPLRMPATLVAAVAARRESSPPVEHHDNDERERNDALRRERDRMQSAYVALLEVPPRSLELITPVRGPDRDAYAACRPSGQTTGHPRELSGNDVASAAPVLRLGPAAAQSFLANHA